MTGKDRCETCIHRIYDYCIEHDKYIKPDDVCEDYFNRETADLMCKYMCPCPEEEK